jgi:hypothetical protein
MGTGRRAGQLQEGCASERAAGLPGPLPAGAVRLAAVGSWSLAAWAALAQPQGGGRSRRQRPTAVDDAPGARPARLTRWERPPTDTGERAVALGERPRLAARRVAVRVPQDVAETRRRRGRQAARDQGRQGHPAGAGRLAGRRDAWPGRALDLAGGRGAGADAGADGAARQVVEEAWPRGRGAQHPTWAPAL